MEGEWLRTAFSSCFVSCLKQIWFKFGNTLIARAVTTEGWFLSLGL